MNQIGIKQSSIEKIIERLQGERPRGLRISVRPLHGGLEALAVLRVTAVFQDRFGRCRIANFVAKRLEESGAREASIYQQIVTEHARNLAPRLLGVDHQSGGGAVLYLECVRPVTRWPWRDLTIAKALIGGLARFHSSTAAANAAASLPSWDYEAELKKSSETILELLTRCRHSDFASLARHLSLVRRLTLALPAMRRELLAFSPFGNVAIHGAPHKHVSRVHVLISFSSGQK